MNLFGIDILQLIIYLCVGASFIVVVYILKLTRTRNKTKTQPKPTEETTEETFSNVATITTPNEIIKQLIALIDKMWSHSVGLDSCSNPKPEPAPSKRQKQKKQEPQLEPEPKPEPTLSPSIQKIDEETYTPTDEDKELLENIRKQLGEK